jgi:hypothetical protein
LLAPEPTLADREWSRTGGRKRSLLVRPRDGGRKARQGMIR